MSDSIGKKKKRGKGTQPSFVVPQTIVSQHPSLLRTFSFSAIQNNPPENPPKKSYQKILQKKFLQKKFQKSFQKKSKNFHTILKQE